MKTTTILFILIALLAVSKAAEPLEYPKNLPQPARPVWAAYKAAELNDLGLFREQFSAESIFLLETAGIMGGAFASTVPPVPLDSMLFTASRSGDITDGRVLPIDYALVYMHFGSKSYGTIVKYEDDVWKINTPTQTNVFRLLEGQTHSVDP